MKDASATPSAPYPDAGLPVATIGDLIRTWLIGKTVLDYAGNPFVIARISFGIADEDCVVSAFAGGCQINYGDLDDKIGTRMFRFDDLIADFSAPQPPCP